MEAIEIVKNWNHKNKGFLVQQLAYGGGTSDEFVELVLEFIAAKSAGFQADIAKRAIESAKAVNHAFPVYRMSEKQAWCVEFEFAKLKDQFEEWYSKS